MEWCWYWKTEGHREETCPVTTSSTTYPTCWPGIEPEPVRWSACNPCRYRLRSYLTELLALGRSFGKLYVASMVGVEGGYRVLLGKPEGRRPLGRPRRRWVDNIRMDLQEVGCGYMDWIGLTQDRDRWRTLVSALMNLRVLWNAGNFLTSCKPVSFSRRTLHHGVSKCNRCLS